MSKVFVFLEFEDPEIYSLLCEMRRILNRGGNPSSHVHITVRGPFKELRSEKGLASFQEKLGAEPILLSGVGKFSTKGKDTVFLKASSTHLIKIWHKPDYPINEYGFNPHISLFEGSPNDAEKIHNFIEKEDLSLVSHDYKIVQYSSKNMELFKPEEKIFSEKDFMRLVINGRVKSGILDRAKELVGHLNPCQQLDGQAHEFGRQLSILDKW